MTNTEQRDFCGKCGASITETDKEAGYCTQCKAPIAESLSQSLLSSLLSLKVRKRHGRLIQLAAKRGYSMKALTALVRSAEDAYQLAHA